MAFTVDNEGKKTTTMRTVGSSSSSDYSEKAEPGTLSSSSSSPTSTGSLSDSLSHHSFSHSTNSDSERDDSAMKDVEMSPFKGDEELGGLGASSPPPPPPSISCIDWIKLKAKHHAQVLSACSFYSFCSVSMVLVNKSLASR